jgi:hypothetical protein
VPNRSTGDSSSLRGGLVDPIGAAGADEKPDVVRQRYFDAVHPWGIFVLREAEDVLAVNLGAIGHPVYPAAEAPVLGAIGIGAFLTGRCTVISTGARSGEGDFISSPLCNPENNNPLGVAARRV